MDWESVLKSSLTLFAIVNPIGSIPIFLHLTGRLDKKERRRAFHTATLASIAILITFIIAGEGVLLYFFRVGHADLMAAGGLLLLIIAIDHLVFGALVGGVEGKEQIAPHHIGAVPIACPILAGPGAMMTVLLIHTQYGYVVAFSSVLLVFGLTWLILTYIDVIFKVLGDIICIVLSKILCLFIAAIGVRMLMQAVLQYFKP